jgi:hypothetical protein
MWTFKNVLAQGMFLFGTTFLWMTPSFAGRNSATNRTAWRLANVLRTADHTSRIVPARSPRRITSAVSRVGACAGSTACESLVPGARVYAYQVRDPTGNPCPYVRPQPWTAGYSGRRGIHRVFPEQGTLR